MSIPDPDSVGSCGGRRCDFDLNKVYAQKMGSGKDVGPGLTVVPYPMLTVHITLASLYMLWCVVSKVLMKVGTGGMVHPTK